MGTPTRGMTDSRPYSDRFISRRLFQTNRILILAVFFPIIGVIIDIAIEFFIVNTISLIPYALQKNLAFGFETSGGAYYGLSFKRGVLNNVKVDITQVENALQLVPGAASLGTDYADQRRQQFIHCFNRAI